jgi:hypothetical protein
MPIATKACPALTSAGSMLARANNATARTVHPNANLPASTFYPYGTRGARQHSIDDKAVVAMCIAVIVGVLALSGGLSGENVKDIHPAVTPSLRPEQAERPEQVTTSGSQVA